MALAKSWGSKITPELEEYCKKAGGKAKVFPDNCTNDCAIVIRKKSYCEKTLPSIIANCYCGSNRCLKNNKCVPIPKQ